MAKNVIIAEGATGRRMPDVQKILTLRPTTGSDLWVPVDERLSRTKYITKNGTFYATEEEIYAFSKVTVNVPGGVQGVTTPTTTVEISNTSPDAIPDINPVTGNPNNVSIDTQQIDPLTSPTAIPQASGISGSSIMGVDPDTGIMTMVGVSPDGTIRSEQFPTSIRICNKPSKLNYVDGEDIDFSGLEVQLYSGDAPFSNSVYPTGKIKWTLGPYAKPTPTDPYRNYELLTSPTTAVLDTLSKGVTGGIPWITVKALWRVKNEYCTSNTTISMWEGPYVFVGQRFMLELDTAIATYQTMNYGERDVYYGSGDISNYEFHAGTPPTYKDPDPIPYHAVGTGYRLYLVRYQGNIYEAMENIDSPVEAPSSLVSAGENFRCYDMDDKYSGKIVTTSISGGGITWRNGGTFEKFTGSVTYTISEDELPESPINPTDKTAAYMRNGAGEGEQMIVVSWENPYTGQVLSDSYYVRVSPAPSGDDDYSGSGGGSF